MLRQTDFGFAEGFEVQNRGKVFHIGGEKILCDLPNNLDQIEYASWLQSSDDATVRFSFHLLNPEADRLVVHFPQYRRPLNVMSEQAGYAALIEPDRAHLFIEPIAGLVPESDREEAKARASFQPYAKHLARAIEKTLESDKLKSPKKISFEGESFSAALAVATVAELTECEVDDLFLFDPSNQISTNYWLHGVKWTSDIWGAWRNYLTAQAECRQNFAILANFSLQKMENPRRKRRSDMYHNQAIVDSGGGFLDDLSKAGPKVKNQIVIAVPELSKMTDTKILIQQIEKMKNVKGKTIVMTIPRRQHFMLHRYPFATTGLRRAMEKSGLFAR